MERDAQLSAVTSSFIITTRTLAHTHIVYVYEQFLGHSNKPNSIKVLSRSLRNFGLPKIQHTQYDRRARMNNISECLWSSASRGRWPVNVHIKRFRILHRNE